MLRFFRRKPVVELQHPHVKELLDALKIKTKKPDLYLQSLRHKSVYDSVLENNERLEFLGDSILDSVIAEVLFEKFPEAKEGFLTRIRSRIVSRPSLNKIGIALKLDKLIEVQMGKPVRDTSLCGNAFEALIGALYLDKGYVVTNKFIRDQIISPLIDFEKIVAIEPDPKSRLIEYAQKQQIPIRFDTQLIQRNNPIIFESCVIFDHEEISKASGSSKKRAEQKASAMALVHLIPENSNPNG